MGARAKAAVARDVRDCTGFRVAFREINLGIFEPQTKKPCGGQVLDLAKDGGEYAR